MFGEVAPKLKELLNDSEKAAWILFEMVKEVNELIKNGDVARVE
jgi:hypothetical protein